MKRRMRNMHACIIQVFINLDQDMGCGQKAGPAVEENGILWDAEKDFIEEYQRKNSQDYE
jgi:hypothetical protein